jgi:hypothetical protein
MSIGSMGIVGGAAGTPLSQVKQAEAERTRAAADQQRKARADGLTESASDVGRADGENHESHDRDADGRLGYMLQEPPSEATAEADVATDDVLAVSPPASDPSGISGSKLDLLG